MPQYSFVAEVSL